MNPVALINPDTPGNTRKALHGNHVATLEVPRCTLVAPPVSGHPDIQLFPYHDSMVVHPGMPLQFIERLEKIFPLQVKRGQSHLSEDHPSDCPYNVACTGLFAFHNTGFTDPVIVSMLRSRGLPLLHVPQGYTRCATMVVDGNAVISADRKICDAARNADLAVLQVQPGHVTLPGYRYGLLGGASVAYNATVYLAGSLEYHPDGTAIREFIQSRKIELVELSSGQIYDLGSFFILDGYPGYI